MDRTRAMLAALIIGTVVGALIRWQGHSALIALAQGLMPLGTLWVRALQMTLVPLIFAMVTHGMAVAVASGRGNRLIGTTLALFAGAMVVTVTASTLLVETVLRVWPIPAHALDGLIPASAPQPVPGLAAQLIAVIPDNPIAAAANGQIFPLVIFALALGVALARIKRDGPVEAGAIMRLLAELASAMLQIVDWVLWVAPAGIFCLALGLGLTSGLGMAHVLGVFIALCFATCVMMGAACYVVVRTVGAAPLDPYPTRFAHRDGADFGPVQGERSVQCGDIVREDRRRNGPKSARPCGVALGSPVAALRRLHGAHQPALRVAPRHGASQSNHGVQTWSDRGLGRWAAAIAPAQAMAAGSCSSLATMPLMIETAVERLNLPEDVAGLVVPLAGALFRLGTVAHAVAAVLVAAHAMGIQPGPLQLVLAALGVMLGSVSGAGLPGAAVVYAIYGPGLQVLGAPMAIMPLYVAVIALADPIITATNVTGDLTAATLVNRRLRR
jgi:Na+/H+-dicarboxylate symporter